MKDRTGMGFAPGTLRIDLEEKWGRKYPVVIDSWKRNWDKLSTYFNYSSAIRKLIYTTNTIEGFHRQVSPCRIGV